MARGGYRPGAGRTPGIRETKPRARKKGPGSGAKKKASMPEIPKDIIEDAAIENMEPLEYMLKVMNNPNESKEMRARMAIAAAPFVHARVTGGKGKKHDREEKAKAAGSGKFATGVPPVIKRVK